MPPFMFDDYATAEGKPALSVRVHITDMPCKQTDFPRDLRQRAEAASLALQDAFNDLAQSLQIERDLVVGARLDPRKRHSVGVALRRGEVDAAVLRPYQRRSLTLDLPRVAIVASAGTLEVNSDQQYVGRALQLCLAVSWACEAIGMEVYGALIEAHGTAYLARSQPYRAAQLAYMLVEPGRATNLQAYTVAMNRDRFYEQGYAGAYGKDPVAQQRFSALRGNDRLSWGSTFPGYNGGEGVHWARTFLDADLIIGIGKLTDIDAADIRLGNHFNVEQACAQVAQQARGLARER